MDSKTFDEMAARMSTAAGFVAALDQSGGSTPKALALYGIEADQYQDEAEMFDLIHAMRTRIMTSPAFLSDRVLAAILFEGTMDRQVDGMGSAAYLWQTKGIVPILKVDKGLAEESSGVQVMKPIDGLEALLERALDKGVFGTKMRSVIKSADPAGIDAIVQQQFDIGERIGDMGLVPILEPEVDITSLQKSEIESILLERILESLSKVPAGRQVMLKLSLPSVDNLYRPLIDHPAVMRVVALSGGYSRSEANGILARNSGMIASFSRALTEGLTAQQSEDEFNAMLDQTIAEIYAASIS
jgi:fructose-bisphosphate aldolase class I